MVVWSNSRRAAVGQSLAPAYGLTERAVNDDRHGAGRVVHGKGACSMEAFGIGDLIDGEAKSEAGMV